MSEKRGETSYGAEKQNLGSKKLLGELTQKKIAYYQSKNALSEADLYSVVKDYFGELLDIKNEYTCAELLVELKKTYFEREVKNKVEEFIKRISIIEYKDKAFTNEDLRKAFMEFSSLVNLTLGTTRIKSSVNIFNALKTMFSKKEKLKTEKKEEPEMSTDEILERLDNLTTEKPKSENKDEEELPEVSEEELEEKNKKEEDSEMELAITSLDADELLPGTENKDNTWTNIPDAPKEELAFTENVADDWSKDVDFVPKKSEGKDDSLVEEVTVGRPELKDKKEKLEEKVETKKEEPAPKKEVAKTTKKKTVKKKTTTKKTTKKTTPTKKAVKKPNISSMIKSAKNLRKKDKLKEKYKEINKVYETLSNKDKEKYYPDIHKIYDKLKAMKN